MAVWSAIRSADFSTNGWLQRSLSRPRSGKRILAGSSDVANWTASCSISYAYAEFSLFNSTTFRRLGLVLGMTVDGMADTRY